MKNKITRLSYIITILSKGNCLKTPFLVKELNVSQKIIQTDFKEYILLMFDNLLYIVVAMISTKELADIVIENYSVSMKILV